MSPRKAMVIKLVVFYGGILAVFGGLIGFSSWYEAKHPIVCLRSHRALVTRCADPGPTATIGDCRATVQMEDDVCDKRGRKP